MSIFSQNTKTSSVRSSILKKGTNLSKRFSEINTQPKVRFVLPHSKRVHNILIEVTRTGSSRDYENLLVLLRDAELLDDDLSSLLKEATQCISLLNRDLRLFVEAILGVRWVDRNKSVVSEYQSFIVNLISAHNYHAKFVIDKLVFLYIPDSSKCEWPDGVPLDSDCLKFVNIHYLLNILLVVVPMCKELLLHSLRHHFPYHTKSTHIHECYLHNLIWTMEYQPSFRSEILHLIFSKLVIMDVNAPKGDIEKAANSGSEEIFLMDDDTCSVKTSSSHNIAHTLDVCLAKLYNYIIEECHSPAGELDWNKTKSLYHDLITVFDKVILPTYNTHHVQFVMFVMCSLKSSITEAFLNYLWKKVCNPCVAPVIRQASVNYIASLIARANYVPFLMLKGTLQQMADWVHSYIGTQDGLEYINSDVRVHSVFYSVCQALFYVVVFRKKDLLRTKKDIIFLESMNLAKTVTCRLNPLRVCQPAVAQNFAALTRKYQLAYCYSVMEQNSRNTIPTIYQDEKGAIVMSNNVLDAFYPFDPYVLERSSQKIQLLYREYKEKRKQRRETEQMEITEAEVDDFLYQENPHSSSYKFSYGSSPGFKFKG
ncbi:unnamed protein product [Brassicogethes aeneus]|uniref:RNA polymerase I-specific transcription initiation factor RRN3 n=1 Tax=Brassicogethes aeneus TaxID=1431903 RepID=A0A9P0B6I2_BRAAE|nr:unnamed protein product [Brassicogethes aeneus]